MRSVFSIKKRKNRERISGVKKGVLCAAAVLLTGVFCCPTVSAAQAAPAVPEAVFIQMPGFVVEQWSAPRLMLVHQAAKVTVLPDLKARKIGEVAVGQFVNAWGQTDTGWYFIECSGTVAYVRYEAAAFVTPEQLSQAQAAQEAAKAQAAQAARQAQAAQAAAQAAAKAQAAQAAQQAQAAQEAAKAQAAEAARQAQIAAMAAQQPAVAAGIVFIGDSRMVTLKEAVEKNLGACPAAVVAENGSRYEWFHDKAIPQADRIIGKGSRVVINMGVNDLNHADKYAQDVNFWAAVWSARGAQVYYASVNPVWANNYSITQERVDLFNARLRPQLIPQIIWLDSSSYLFQSGVHAVDGLHYKDDTNLVLFNYYMTMIGAV